MSFILPPPPPPTISLIPIFNSHHPHPLPSAAGTPFYYHGANGPDPSFQTHGIVSIGLSDGFISTLPLISYTQLLAHGFGMACMYLILIPLGIIMSRYLKNYPGWIYLHASIQVSGVVGVAIFLGVVLMTYQNYSGSHARLGLTIIILTRKEVRQSAAAGWFGVNELISLGRDLLISVPPLI